MEEAFFVPCTRMRDLMRAWNIEHEDDEDGDFVFPEDLVFEEVELRAGVGVSADDFLHPDFTFDNFYQLARRKIVWMGPEMFVDALDDERFLAALMDFVDCFGYDSPLFSVRPAGSTVYDELQVYSRSMTDVTTTVCDYVFQLMTRSSTIWTHLQINVLSSVSTLALSRFLNKSRISGGNILFGSTSFSRLSQDHLRDYLRVLEVSTGPHHWIELRHETKWSRLVTATVANFLQHCQCAIALKCWSYPLLSLIIDAFRGDCNIVELLLNGVPDIDGLVLALAENKSLVCLTFCSRISDDNWTVLCQSLSSHPKLEHLKFFRTFPCEVPNQHSNERKARRTNVFLKMLQANTVLQELTCRGVLARDHYDEFDERILADVIEPYFRRLPHVRAFGKYRGPGYAQVLARALYKVDDNPALLGMLIRNNIPAILGFGEDN